MLTWLVSQVNILRDRISALWNNAYYWAKYKAESAYNRAVAWASDTINILKSTVWNLYYAAKNHATNLLKGVTSTILYWYNRAVGAAQSLAKGARSLAQDLYHNAIATVLYWYDRAKSAAQTLFKVVSESVIALRNSALVWLAETQDRIVAWAQGIVDSVAGSLNTFIKQFQVEFEELKTKVGIDEPVKQGTLLHFLQSPGSFILAYVWSIFLEFLEWSLAYALGTTIDPLPPLPNWFEEGFGGAILTGTGPPPGSSGLAPPLDKVYISGYIFRKGHPGIDLGLAMGTPVYAMHSGIVEISKWSTIGYGFYVTIKSDEWWTLYGHLEILGVSPGQRVSARDTIGIGNSTGNSTGPHLHLEIKHRGKYIDPLTVL